MIANPSARANPDTRTNTTERRLPYTFDAPPKILHDLIRQKVLKGTRPGRTRRAAPLAESVSVLLLGHQGHHRTQPPMLRPHRPAIPRPTRGRRTHPASRGLPARTSRSRRPAQPHRMAHFFPWLNPNPSPLGPAPDRRPNDRRRKPADDRRMETILSPPLPTILSPQGETKMTPKISLEVNQDRNQTTTTLRATGAGGDRHPCMRRVVVVFRSAPLKPGTPTDPNRHGQAGGIRPRSRDPRSRTSTLGDDRAHPHRAGPDPGPAERGPRPGAADGPGVRGW